MSKRRPAKQTSPTAAQLGLMRHSMPLETLRKSLAEERAKSRLVLFGVDVLSPFADRQIGGMPTARFPDEITALRSFVVAAIRLGGGSGTLQALCRRAEQFEGTDCRSTATGAVLRPRPPRASRRPSAAQGRSLDDYVDVGNRLRQVKQENLELLVEYYVLRGSATELAQTRGIDSAALGGRLSQAKRALREALDDLLPPRSKGSSHDRRKGRTCPGTDQLVERRARVARMIEKRLNNATGEGAK